MSTVNAANSSATSATVNAAAAPAVPSLLLPVIAALAALPPRPSFEQTPAGQAFALIEKTSPESYAALVSQGIPASARANWEKDNLDNPFESLEIACAHLLAASVPAGGLGTVMDSIRSRYYALNGLTALTDKAIGEALLAGKGETFDVLASVFARVKLAKETVSTAEGVRLARLSPSSYPAVNKWLAVGVMVETIDKDGKKSAASVDSILAPAARKWAKANNIELVPAPKQEKDETKGGSKNNGGK